MNKLKALRCIWRGTHIWGANAVCTHCEMSGPQHHQHIYGRKLHSTPRGYHYACLSCGHVTGAPDPVRRVKVTT